MAEPINWTALIRHGMGALHLSPDAFWSMTPAELRLALEGAGLMTGDAPMGRDWLTTLMTAHPDHVDQAGSEDPAHAKQNVHRRRRDGN